MTEELCLKCGRCCYIKKHIGRGKCIITKACEHLDENNLCKIYNTKEKGELGNKNQCLSAKEAFEQRGLPPDCPYVKHYNKGIYITRVINWKRLK